MPDPGGAGLDPRVALYDARTIHQLPWPDTPAARHARRFLVPFLAHGPQTLIDNAPVEMLALVTGSTVLPVVVGPELRQAADVCSPYSHYIEYTRDELRKIRAAFVRGAVGAAVSAASVVVRAGLLDRVVFVNNWLLATNPSPELTATDMRMCTRALIERFPDRAVVVRTVNPDLDPGLARDLRDCGYVLVPSRQVYVADTASAAYRRNANVRRDRVLLETHGWQLVHGEDLTDADAPRLAALYRGLYLDKHSRLNPHMNERYFALALRERWFRFAALRRGGRVDAFAAYTRRPGLTTSFLIGYDLAQPREAGLYRQAIALLFAAAEAHGDLLNISGGAGSFKRFRSATACQEFDAVYARHLPAWRRLAWRVPAAGGRWQRAVAAGKR